MNWTSAIILGIIVALFYVVVLLALMAWMAKRAARTAAPAESLISAAEQGNFDEAWRAFARENGYKQQKKFDPKLSERVQVWRKGRGWLTSLTDIRIEQQDDGQTALSVWEGVNFFVTIVYFPITADTFLGVAIRQRKIKAVNRFLQTLNAEPLVAPQGKRIKLQKN